MSKVSAMQAMREARYAGARSRPVGPVQRVAPGPSAAPTTSSPDDPAPYPQSSPGPAATADPALELPEHIEEPAAEEALCGHRSMNNRNCRRPAGHAEKNHRYN